MVLIFLFGPWPLPFFFIIYRACSWHYRNLIYACRSLKYKNTICLCFFTFYSATLNSAFFSCGEVILKKCKGKLILSWNLIFLKYISCTLGELLDGWSFHNPTNSPNSDSNRICHIKRNVSSYTELCISFINIKSTVDVNVTRKVGKKNENSDKSWNIRVL